MKSQEPARRIGTRIALGGFSLVLSVGVAEFVASRLYEPPLKFPDKFTPFARIGRFTPPINNLGFRQTPSGKDASAAGVTRIVFLGDSFTFGDGIERGKDRFTDLIESRLNADDASGGGARRFHTYNAGVSGSRPNHWVRYFERLLPAYKPDLVLAIFFLRDGTNLCTSLRCHRRTIEEIRAKYESRLFHRVSSLARLYYARKIMREFSVGYRDQVLNSYLGTDGQRTIWVDQQEALRDIRDRCWALGAEFHLIIFPMLFDLDRYPYGPVEDEISRFAREADIRCFSLLEGFRGRDARSLWVAAHDQHPNEQGHRIAADTLYPYLRRAIGASE